MANDPWARKNTSAYTTVSSKPVLSQSRLDFDRGICVIAPLCNNSSNLGLRVLELFDRHAFAIQSQQAERHRHRSGG